MVERDRTLARPATVDREHPPAVIRTAEQGANRHAKHVSPAPEHDSRVELESVAEPLRLAEGPRVEVHDHVDSLFLNAERGDLLPSIGVDRRAKRTPLAG